MEQSTGKSRAARVGDPTSPYAEAVRPSVLIGIAPLGIRIRCGCGCGFTRHNCRNWQTTAARVGHGALGLLACPLPGEPRFVRVPCACGMDTPPAGEAGALRAWHEHVLDSMRRESRAALRALPRDPMRGVGPVRPEGETS